MRLNTDALALQPWQDSDKDLYIVTQVHYTTYIGVEVAGRHTAEATLEAQKLATVSYPSTLLLENLEACFVEPGD